VACGGSLFFTVNSYRIGIYGYRILFAGAGRSARLKSEAALYTEVDDGPLNWKRGGRRAGLLIVDEGLRRGASVDGKNGQEGQKGAKKRWSSLCPFLPFLSVFALKLPSPLSPSSSMN
jgi:hypothetical protein